VNRVLSLDELSALGDIAQQRPAGDPAAAAA